jgi:N-acylneuraminate cytidylyltransferase
MNSLIIIPARGGSKRIPRKNIKPLNGKPLIEYTIDVARKLAPDYNICVSTDDMEIAETVEQYGLKIPFIRPQCLSTDNAGTYEVLLHALNFYEQQGIFYTNVILLQTTSPFRNVEHVKEALGLYRNDIDMVVSVKTSSANPYYNCFEETSEGFLYLSKGDGKTINRQNAPKVWMYNGAIYIINPDSLKKQPLSSFQRKIKYEMDEYHSLDLDTLFDWDMAEFMLKSKYL